MDLYQKYLESAIHFLSYRPRSEKEVRDNLKKKQASPQIIEKIIAWLKENKFLNDTEFAQMFIRSRSEYRQRSHRIIKMELRQKGITDDVIEQAMEGLQTDNDSKQIANDQEMATIIARKKIGKYKHLEKQEIYQKLGAFLSRRGFTWDNIKKAIGTSLSEES